MYYSYIHIHPMSFVLEAFFLADFQGRGGECVVYIYTIHSVVASFSATPGGAHRWNRVD